MNDNTTEEPQENVELQPLKSADDTEFEDVVLKDPEGAEYIRAEDSED